MGLVRHSPMRRLIPWARRLLSFIMTSNLKSYAEDLIAIGEHRQCLALILAVKGDPLISHAPGNGYAHDVHTAWAKGFLEELIRNMNTAYRGQPFQIQYGTFTTDPSKLSCSSQVPGYGDSQVV
ncbi:hypothetical protein HOY82DRAFT_622255 [Tuber indicum]|nr:hypothetical protein HOY82DRAFT_622255 [Tuber indicum]